MLETLVMELPKFSQKAQEELGYYVYCLVDPRDKTIFYVGKGVGNRVFAHANDALENESNSSDKLDKIREIISAGEKVCHYIIRHKLSEEDAFTVESVLIDFLTYPSINKETILTNIVAGHHQWDEGIKTVQEIEQMYNCEPLILQPDHKLLMVNLNRTYNQSKVSSALYKRPDMYEATRKYWHLNKANADEVDYVLGVYKGIVRIVIKPTTKWQKAEYDENGNKYSTSRYFIEGITEGHEGNTLYLNKDTKAYPFPSGGAIRYIK